MRHGIIQGWSWNNNLPSYSHLKFVDDTRLMGMARISEALNFRQALDIYLKASRKCINEDNSSIYLFNISHLI